jgi:hypothetical protein
MRALQEDEEGKTGRIVVDASFAVPGAPSSATAVSLDTVTPGKSSGCLFLMCRRYKSCRENVAGQVSQRIGDGRVELE